MAVPAFKMIHVKDVQKVQQHQTPVYREIFKVHVQCVIHEVIKKGVVHKWVYCTVRVLVINDSIISIHSFLKKGKTTCFLDHHAVMACLLSNVGNMVGDKLAATSCDGQNMSG